LWRHIKLIAGAVETGPRSDHLVNLTRYGEQVNFALLPDILNEFFILVSADISPLDSFSLDSLRGNLGQVPDHFIVSEYAVYCALSRLKLSKTTCDDILSNRLLVDLANILAAPICAIINSSV
jgi:hypothetical protein